jgi:cell division protein FtsZ
MSLSLPTQVDPELRPRITVIGVGGAGGNAVSNMIRANLSGVEFIVTNTDAQAMSQTLAESRIQLGAQTTRGLGAGARPEVGRAAAEEAIDDILEQLQGSNMAFITAGMGGGTGTGAAPVIARAAREHGILTIGVVTKPFQFEGAHRMKLAEQGIQDLQQYVDTLIVIPNQNLFRLANERTTFADAFKMADDVLHSGVRGVTDLMVMPGLINLDFADIRAVMGEMGKAMMGTGEAVGDRRALDAAEAAISNPLLEDTSMKGARGVLINITGGYDMTLFEVDEAANRIRDEVDPNANIIFGSTFDESLDGKMRVSVVATGIDVEADAESRKPQISLVSDRPKTMPTPAAAPVTSGFVPAMAQASVGIGAGAVASATMSAPTASAAVAEAPAMGRFDSQGSAALATSAYAQAAPAPMASTRPIPPASMPAPRAVTTRPVPPQRTATGDEPFIAPAPVDPSTAAAQPAQAKVEPAQADPFAAAAMANPPPPPVARAPERAPQRPQPQPEVRMEKPRAPSLFERVTGTARRAAPPMVAQPARAPVTPPPAQPQPRLGQIDPGERLASSPVEDDLLDIPAFLRRQAN